MNPYHVASTSSPPPVANPLPAKRKRGRPRKDASMTQGESSRGTSPKEEVNLVGKTISGEVEGSFEAGFIINVKVKDSDTRLRGLVFARGKVVPVTPENDVAPHVKMFVREEFKNHTDDRYKSFPNDQKMKDAVIDSELSECARALILLPHGINGEDPEEVMEEREAANRLVEIFQTSETTMVTGQQNLVLARKETNEQHKSPGEARGFDLMAEEPVYPVEEVPQELQLGLGNETILRGDNSQNGTAMEIDLKSSMSRNGFIAKLLRGKEKVDC
ncbi:DNA binding protein [Hirschfeldia incana]|nr:DNA binding protein [Hirschfeldia incana]